MARTPQAFDQLTTVRLHLTLSAALSPVALAACLLHGWAVAFLFVSTVVVAWIADWLRRQWFQPQERNDGSAVLWGLLMVLLMPPSVPFWVPWIGILFGILVVKSLLGGSGSPWINPVLAGWAFCQAGWPALMNASSDLPGIGQNLSVLDQEATAFLNGNFFSWMNIQLPGGYVDLVLGLGSGNPGVLGGIAPIFLLLGTVFLLVRGTIPWQIPALFFPAYVIPLALLGGNDILNQVFSGSLLLGVFFLATDTASRPLNARGMMVFAAGAGFMAFLLQLWGGHADGSGYAILLMNFLVPWLDQRLRKKVLNDLG